MALILHIETATPVCSVGLSRDGKIIGIAENHEDKSHATQLTLLIEALLIEHNIQVGNLDAISISMGPGSYTGLRIGASVVKGLAYAASIKVIGVSTLKSLASTALEKIAGTGLADTLLPDAWLCPMIDARRLEVYRAFYNFQLDEMKKVEAEILNAESFSEILTKKPVLFFGNGSNKAQSLLHHENALFVHGVTASASGQTTLSEKAYQNNDFLDVAYFEPSYLKEFIATLPKNKIF